MSSPDGLRPLLERLRQLSGPGEEAAVGELQRRLEQGRFRVLVAGEAKRGKSSLLNALLGRQLLPTGVVPVTSVTTTLAYGRPERIVVRTSSQAVGELPLDELGNHVTEAGNPGNRRGVVGVTVLVDAPVLADGLELVDTPGVGSVHDHDPEAARALRNMDAAVLVLTVDPPISAAERDLLRRVSEGAVRVFVVLNKVDRLDVAELAEAEMFTRTVLADTLPGQELQLYPCSAHQGLQARLDGCDDASSGVPAFEAALSAYLATRRGADLQRSLVGRATEMTGDLLDAVRVTLRADELRDADGAGRIAVFREHLQRLLQKGLDCEDLVPAAAARLLADLNDEAGRAERALAARVATLVGSQLAEQTPDLSGGRLQTVGQAMLAEAVRAVVEPWRDTCTEFLEAGLLDLRERLIASSAAELADLQQVADRELDLRLGRGPAEVELAEDPRFVYDFEPDIGQTELLAGAVRTRLPGRTGRRRVVAYLCAQADQITRRQVGRIRADLQTRLRETTRDLAATIGARHEAWLHRLRDALDEAERLAADPQFLTVRAALKVREAALRELLVDLDLSATRDPGDLPHRPRTRAV